MGKRKLKPEEIVSVRQVLKGPPGFKYKVMVREEVVAMTKEQDFADLLGVTLKRLIIVSDLVGEARLVDQMLLMTEFLTNSQRILSIGMKSKKPAKSRSKII